MASDIPDQMLACQVIEYNKPYKIHQIPVPKSLGPTDILVKIAVASYCHTDSMVSAGDFFTKLPCIGSHEGAGAVVALGSDVKNLQIGDRVMCGIPTHFCGHCHDCLGPETFRQYCRNLGGHTGVTRDGCFAEYALVDSVTSAKLPDEVSFETAAPLACAGCTVFRGVVLSGLHAGESLAIIGSGGGLGHLGVQFAKAFGMKVIGIDARDEGLALTEKAGADVVIDARKGDEAAVEEVKKVTGGMGVDATVNVSDAKTAAATACAVTKMHGLVIQIAQVSLAGTKSTFITTDALFSPHESAFRSENSSSETFEYTAQ